jgi:branched-chain amino acid transport system permease protein
MLTLTYAFGVGLAGLWPACIAAPIYQVSPRQMGSSLIIVTVFAVVVIGGMGSIIRRDRHRPTCWASIEGSHQGLLPAGIDQRRDLRHHGDRRCSTARPGCSARRPSAAHAADMSTARPDSILENGRLRLVIARHRRRGPAVSWSTPVFADDDPVPRHSSPAPTTCCFGYVGLLAFGHAAFYGGIRLCGTPTRPQSTPIPARTRHSGR